MKGHKAWKQKRDILMISINTYHEYSTNLNSFDIGGKASQGLFEY